MPEKHLYEYAIIRVVPMVEREEFMNVGVILFCKKAKYIQVFYDINKKKLNAIGNELDIEQIRLNLEAFETIANGEKNNNPISEMEIASRFRWLTAVRSSIIQTSRPHPGLCEDLQKTTRRLFEELVL